MSDRLFFLLWISLVAAGSLLNAATWLVTGSVWSLAISLFAAATAMYLTEVRRHV